MRFTILLFFSLLFLTLYTSGTTLIDDPEVNLDLIKILTRLNQNETEVIRKGKGIHALLLKNLYPVSVSYCT
jgi:hypothetical protein